MDDETQNRCKMTLRNIYWLAVAVICFSPLSVEALIEKRNGVSFVQDTDLSLGFATHNVISVLDSSLLLQSYEVAESLRQKLYETFQKMKQIPKVLFFRDLNKIFEAEAEDSKTERQFSDLVALSDTAKEKWEETQIYIGNPISKSKRSAGSAATSLGGLFYKIGKDLFGFEEETGYEKRMRNFVEVFQPPTDRVNTTVEDVITFNEEQISYNRKIVNEISELDERFEVIESQIPKISLDVESRLKMQFMINFLKITYQEFIQFQQKILDGLISATEGLPLDPFFSPSKLLQVLINYQENRYSEKSIYGKEDILKLMDLAVTTVTKFGDKVGVTTTVRIPTSSTWGRLFRIVSFPIFDEEKDSYVTLKTDYKYIVINQNSQYILMNDEDINSCSKSSTMIMCDTGNMIWKNRDDASCEAAVWFNDEEVTKQMCNYDIEEAKIVRLTHVNQGIYHFTMPKEYSVPFQCTGDFPRSENVPLQRSGFIRLSPRCVATVQSHILRNLLTDKVKTFSIEDDLSRHNIEDIREAKFSNLRDEAEAEENDISLDNDAIVDSILERKAFAEQEKEISGLFVQSSGVTEEEKEERADIIEEFERIDTEEEANQANMWILVYSLGAMILILTLLLIYFVIVLCRK